MTADNDNNTTLTTDTSPKVLGLADHLGITPEEIQLDGDLFVTPFGDYYVYSDEEADARAEEEILNSLWAFNYEFLRGHSRVIDLIPHNHWTLIAEQLCEDANDLVLACLDDKEHLVQDAISADGRGHFLAPYDFEEIELDGGLFAYRYN